MLPYQRKPLPRSFYTRSTLAVAQDLLGKIVVRETPAATLAARIVEVEAYLGELDPASHAYRGPQGRALIMYGIPGRLYVYFTYGMHYCMNVVAHDRRHAGGILIRAVEPLVGIAQMEQNRGLSAHERQLAKGPACVTTALGVGRDDNGTDLVSGAVRIHAPRRPVTFRLGTSERIGISRAIEEPWRFFVCGHPAVSGPGRLNRCS